MPTSARAECTLFTKIYGEFATSSWADVGIGPYKSRSKEKTRPPQKRGGRFDVIPLFFPQPSLFPARAPAGGA